MSRNVFLMRNMSGNVLRRADLGCAVGLLAGLLLFAGLTAWWYVSFMDFAVAWMTAWMVALVLGVTAVTGLVAYVIKRLTGRRVFIVGALIVTWLFTSRFDFPRIGWALAASGGILGIIYAVCWGIRCRVWRVLPVVLTVILGAGAYQWLNYESDDCGGAYETDDCQGINIMEYGYDYDARRVDGSGYFCVERRLDKIVRDRIWGFDNSRLPLRGTLFYPDSGSLLPLVAIIHGSHYMLDRSDRGYDYLAIQLARRGYAVLSIDENFINKSFTGGYGTHDYIGRGWLLLKNLEYLREIASMAGAELTGKIDFDNVALIGHSRGGDGIAAATWLNGLSRSPMGNDEKYDFRFGIKGVVEIAPTGLLTLPDGTPFIYNNVDYLLLHGDKDGDVSFMYGIRRYNSAVFTDSAYHVKVAVNIAGANHGQFNTVWGDDDRQPPAAWLLDHSGMMSGKAQRKVTAAYISAFLDTSLKGECRLPEMFAPSVGSGDKVQWIDTSTICIADFEADSADTDVVELKLRDRSGMSQFNHGMKIGAEKEYRLRLDSCFAVPPCHDLVFSACGDTDSRVAVIVAGGSGIVCSDTVDVVASSPARLSKSSLLLPIQGDREREQVMHTFMLPLSSDDIAGTTDVRFRVVSPSEGNVIVDNIGFRRHFEARK